jgi:hypothetical protein
MSDNGWCDRCEIELSDKNGSLMDGRLRGTPHTCGKPVESVSPPDWIAKAAKEAAEELGTMYLVNVLRVKELIQSAIERNRP